MPSQDDVHATAQSWVESAGAYIGFQDEGDRNRTMLLDPVMLDLSGDVKGRRMLDLGCGEGRFCRMLADRGAATIGIDPTDEMVRTARARDVSGAYIRAAAEALPFAGGSFDCVVSYVTLVDIVGFRDAIAECARVLTPGGQLVVANLGFVTASPVSGKEWARDSEGKRLYYRVDRYAEEWSKVLEWSGIRIVNWHRPLSAYMGAFLASGLTLRDFLEPVPEDQSIRDDPWFEDWFRVPLFNVMRWVKGE